jgi:hypothetical protein
MAADHELGAARLFVAGRRGPITPFGSDHDAATYMGTQAPPGGGRHPARRLSCRDERHGPLRRNVQVVRAEGTLDEQTWIDASRAARTTARVSSRRSPIAEVVNVLGRRNLGQADGFSRTSLEAVFFTEKLIPRVPSAGLLIEF